MGNKRGLVKAILEQLGHQVPDDEKLQTAIVAAARKVKGEAGLDPGPDVTLFLNPLPTAALRASQFGVRGGKRPLVKAILEQLGHTMPDDNELQSAILAAARTVKEAAGIEPGPSVSLVLTPLPGHSSAASSAGVLGQKKGLVIAILEQLGHPVPEGEKLQSAIVAAARRVKEEAGLDPGPSVKLAITPLPSSSKGSGESEGGLNGFDET